ncbi:G-protein coupled receptor 183-like [Eumetopias jubatus]|uniref:G-protein coupled receptor 183-like n=1 Tax=Eumetopias jubatus TaxID=34886 RepID=UPI0010167878|nr:G-protein coupled receptor 183-like [Eumetopias jubatus]
MSQKGRQQRARLLTPALLVAVVVSVGSYHLNIIRFMQRETPRPPSGAAPRAFRLSLQLTMPLVNVNCGIGPITDYFSSTRYGKWLLGILKLRGVRIPLLLPEKGFLRNAKCQPDWSLSALRRE